MTATEVETIYETLARTLDDVGKEKHDLFLAKLALLLSYEIGDADRVCQLVGEAARALEV